MLFTLEICGVHPHDELRLAAGVEERNFLSCFHRLTKQPSTPPHHLQANENWLLFQTIKFVSFSSSISLINGPLGSVSGILSEEQQLRARAFFQPYKVKKKCKIVRSYHTKKGSEKHIF